MGDRKQIVVLGGGIAGLSAAYFLSKSQECEVTVLESSLQVGGACGSFDFQGFTLDYGPHKFYSIIPGVLNDIRVLMGDKLIRVRKKSSIFIQGRILKYPLDIWNAWKVLGAGKFFEIGWGCLIESFKNMFLRRPEATYEDYVLHRFGRPAYELVFKPLARKIWGNPETLHSDLARLRISSAGGMDSFLKLFKLKKDAASTNAEFFFYPRGGFGQIAEKMKKEIIAAGGRVSCGVNIKRFAVEGKKIVRVCGSTLGKTQEYPCDVVISTIPLSDLSKLLLPQTGTDAAVAVDDLIYQHSILVYLFVRKPKVLDDQWIYFPEEEVVFSRIFEQKCLDPEAGPAEKTVLCCDIICESKSEAWQADDETLIKKCLETLRRYRFIQSEDVFGYQVKRLKNFYPVYDQGYKQKINRVFDQMYVFENLVLSGRLGMFNYNNADHCFDMGREISAALIQEKSVPELRDRLEQQVKSYRIID